MPQEPSADQVKSRNEVQAFLERVKKPARELYAGIKSEWFGRPDNELKDWVERGRWWEEVRDTRWYHNQRATVEHEIRWAQQQFEVGKPEDFLELRAYIKALRFVMGHILTTEKNADIASKVLSQRAGEIEKVTFIRSELNDRSRNY